MKTTPPTLQNVKNIILLSIFALISHSAITTSIHAMESDQKMTLHTRSLTPRSLFECLPQEDTQERVERKLSVADQNMCSKILCTLTRGTYTRNGVPLNINPKDRRPSLPKDIVLNILSFFTQEKLKHRRAIDFTDSRIDLDLDLALRRGAFNKTGQPLPNILTRPGLPHDLRLHIRQFIPEGVEKIKPLTCKITDDGYLITLDKKGNWRRYNITTGACNLHTVIPAIASNKFDAPSHYFFDASPSGEILVNVYKDYYALATAKRSLISIDHNGQQRGKTTERARPSITPSQVIFLPQQQLIVSSLDKTKLLKYNIDNMQLAGRLVIEHSIISGITSIDTEQCAILTHETLPPYTASLHMIKTDNMDIIRSINLGAQYKSPELYETIHSLGSGKFLVYNREPSSSPIPRGYYIIDINSHPLECNGHTLATPLLPSNRLAFGQPIACNNNRYVVVDNQDNIFIGNTQRKSFRRAFSNLPPDFTDDNLIETEMSQNFVTVFNKYENNVIILQRLMVPDLNYT
jgi:hypothetical protein